MPPPPVVVRRTVASFILVFFYHVTIVTKCIDGISIVGQIVLWISHNIALALQGRHTQPDKKYFWRSARYSHITPRDTTHRISIISSDSQRIGRSVACWPIRADMTRSYRCNVTGSSRFASRTLPPSPSRTFSENPPSPARAATTT